MEILRARPEDSDRLTQIAIAAKAHWGYPEAWMQRWAVSLTVAPDFVSTNPVFVALAGSEPIGFYALSGQAAHMELEHLWVLPQWMGQAIGRRLLEHALEQARLAGAPRILIQADPHAEGFYKHMGAKTVRTMRYKLDGHDRVLPVMEIATGAG